MGQVLRQVESSATSGVTVRGSAARVACLVAVGGNVPTGVVTNEDLAERLDVTDEWIVSRIGVRRRHVAPQGVATSDLAVAACEQVLAQSGGGGAGGVVLATTTPDRRCPATAPVVASRLGLGTVPALDVAAVCTGFVYGLSVGAGLIATSVLDSVLVVGADTYSTIVDPADRVSAAIFGDGAGAVLLRAGRPGDPGEIGPVVLASDGAGEDLITIKAGGGRAPVLPGDRMPVSGWFSMEGQAVFRRAVACMVEASEEALHRAGWRVQDVDCVVAHQANQRILDAVASRLGIPSDRMFSNIADVGNTSAASIPLALAEASHTAVLRPGSRVLLAAFGGGLTWGATTLTWPGPIAERPVRDTSGVAGGDGRPRVIVPSTVREVTPACAPLRTRVDGMSRVVFDDESAERLRESLLGHEDDLVLALPPRSARVTAGQVCGVVFTHRGAFDVLAPGDGVVTRRNERLEALPWAAVGWAADPEGPSWLFMVDPDFRH